MPAALACARVGAAESFSDISGSNIVFKWTVTNALASAELAALIVNTNGTARLLRWTGGYLLALSLPLAVLIWFEGEWVLRLVAPGLAGDTLAISARMVRWMGLGVPFCTIAALLGLYGICVNRFRPIALRSAFQNAGLVAVIPLAAWLKNPEWIGLGFALAYVIYLGYVALDLRRVVSSAEGAQVTERPQGGELWALYRAASPLLYIMVLGQLLAIVDRAAASFIGVGAIASLEYARVFVETPHVIIGTAIATTALSRFSALDERVVVDRGAAFHRRVDIRDGDEDLHRAIGLRLRHRELVEVA